MQFFESLHLELPPSPTVSSRRYQLRGITSPNRSITTRMDLAPSKSTVLTTKHRLSPTESQVDQIQQSQQHIIAAVQGLSTNEADTPDGGEAKAATTAAATLNNKNLPHNSTSTLKVLVGSYNVSGTADIFDFLARVSFTAQLHRWSSQDELAAMRLCLTDSAKIVYQSIQVANPQVTLTDYKELITKRFDVLYTSTQRERFLAQIKQTNESSKAFADKCVIALNRVIRTERRAISNQLTPENEYFTDVIDHEYTTEIKEDDANDIKERKRIIEALRQQKENERQLRLVQLFLGGIKAPIKTQLVSFGTAQQLNFEQLTEKATEIENSISLKHFNASPLGVIAVQSNDEPIREGKET